LLLSRPTRARGLKRLPAFVPDRQEVAPHAGAWIETLKVTAVTSAAVAPHAGAWIETDVAIEARAAAGRAPRGRVD